MNPFELQAQFARQWFDIARTMTTAAMSACAAANDQAAMLWSRSSMPWQLPWHSASVPTSAFAPFPWLTSAWSPMGAWPMSWNFQSPFGNPWQVTNPWQANPFTSWMSAVTAKPPAFPGMPFAAGMPSLWAPWAFAPAAGAASWPWASPLSTPSRDSNADLLEQMATNYRTASGYAVAAVIGPLNAALDPRTYGEPWWQKLEKPKKLN